MTCQSKSSGVVTLPFLPVRVVCLAWLKRRASQILKAMEENGASAEMAREVHPGLRELLLAMVNASRFLQRGSWLQAPVQSRSDGSSFEEMGAFPSGGQQFLGILHKVDCVCQMMHSAVLFCGPLNLAVMVYGLKLWFNHQSSSMMIDD